jgi:hypothetical protein
VVTCYSIGPKTNAVGRGRRGGREGVGGGGGLDDILFELLEYFLLCYLSRNLFFSHIFTGDSPRKQS